MRLLQISLTAAVIGCLVLGGFLVRAYLSFDAGPSRAAFVLSSAPNSKIVEKIIDPLRYSGYQDFIRPEVSLDIDFKEGVWTLRNIHRFDEQGNVVLNQGRYGVCEDLVAYTYQRVLPHFPAGQYRIRFAEAVESSFFQDASGGSHIILLIADLEAERSGAKKVYILDPSLRRYGTPDYFDNYRIVGPAPILDFINARERDSVFQVNHGPPIVINRNAIVNLYVGEEDGKFDRDNYYIRLALTRRYQFARKPLFTIRKRAGRVTVEEENAHKRPLIGLKKYKQLKGSVIRLHEDFGRRLGAA
ncbi:MAG: hypothetical protein A3D28_00440 [Omnitrophica bacterium RIFCSPHIGHO2_02_FULL_63_14]|nr:MAG: hypothetical protein A3D28_00440 [Omnitrophica bacterium RIFCSPHIGHO2_02_FULL_63_14]